MYVSTDTRVYHGYTSVRAALSARVASSRAESLASSWMSSRGEGTGRRRERRGARGQEKGSRYERGERVAWWGDRENASERRRSYETGGKRESERGEGKLREGGRRREREREREKEQERE